MTYSTSLPTLTAMSPLGVLPKLSLPSLSAPIDTRSLTISTWPDPAKSYKKVTLSSLKGTGDLAPASCNSLTRSSLPVVAASCRSTASKVLWEEGLGCVKTTLGTCSVMQSISFLILLLQAWHTCRDGLLKGGVEGGRTEVVAALIRPFLDFFHLTSWV